MSNIIPMTGNALGVVPAYLQQAATQSSMGSFGDDFSGGRRVQLKGGMINFLAEDGNPMGTVVSADGTVVTFPQFTNAARIIIVSSTPQDNATYRAFYGTPYKDGESLPPDCWSADGVSPSPKSFAPQADKCANCAKNVSGSSTTGKGKACGSRKRLAVAFADDPELRLFQMDLSSTALFGKSVREAEGYHTLSNYARALKQGGAVWEGVVTEVAFSEGANIGVRFRPVGYVDEQTFRRVLELAQDNTTHELIAVDFPERKVENAPQAAGYQAPDEKTLMLANPAFNTTLAYLKDWAAAAGVTADMIRAEATKVGVAL